MKEEIIIAGFGGQGVLSMGKILAYSGLMDDKEVTWMPSYGPEQRGGTANVTVILSDERISSPVLDSFDIVVALNQQSLDKFAPKVKKGGILIYDTNGIHNRPTRDDIEIYPIDAMDATLELGNSKAYNMVVMGALLEAMPYKLPMENVIKGLKKSLPERHHKLIPLNEQAIEKGRALLKKIIKQIGKPKIEVAGDTADYLLPYNHPPHTPTGSPRRQRKKTEKREKKPQTLAQNKKKQ